MCGIPVCCGVCVCLVSATSYLVTLVTVKLRPCFRLWKFSVVLLILLGCKLFFLPGCLSSLNDDDTPNGCFFIFHAYIWRPVGSFLGSLSSVTATDLGGFAVKEALNRCVQGLQYLLSCCMLGCQGCNKSRRGSHGVTIWYLSVKHTNDWR